MTTFDTSRRAILRSAIAASLAPALPATSRASERLVPTADDELIQLCADLAASRAEVEHINRVGVQVDVCDRAMDRWNELMDRIIDLPARTPDGLRAKAGATRDVLKMNLLDGSGRTMMSLGVEQEDWLGWSLVHDILGEAPPWT